MNNIINISYDSTFVNFSVPTDGFIIWHHKVSAICGELIWMI